MPSDIIQWFPGHMAKTRRLMQESLSQVDIVIELLDARIPASSRNPEIMKIVGQKPLLTLLNKASLADKSQTEKWKKHFSDMGINVLTVDCITGTGISEIPNAVRTVLAEKVQRYNERGMSGRHLRAMIVGIPNVGKSSLINKLAGGKRTKVEDRPGVTRDKQWITTQSGIDLLDMPGVLWPKFDDRHVGENLAITGAIKTEVLNIEEIAMILCERLRDIAPSLLCERYKLNQDEITELDGYDIFNLIGKKRGFMMRGGEINERRTADVILDEFRSGAIGKITLEFSEGVKNA